jgi:CheY-like chemotaxis protein
MKPIVRTGFLLEVIADAWRSYKNDLVSSGATETVGGARDDLSSQFCGPKEPPEGVASEMDYPRNGHLCGGRILVAEDNSVNRRLVVRILEQLGCTVDTAADGLRAVEMCDRFEYDLVFMDCLMPEMDGYQATAEIRRRRNGRRLPIVALTANVLSGDQEKCAAAGMDDYLSKPVRKEDLEQALDRWITGALASNRGAA